MKNSKNNNDKIIYNAAMALVFLGMVLIMTCMVQVFKTAPIMGLKYVLGTLMALGFGYLFTLMGFIILRELENKDNNNFRY